MTDDEHSTEIKPDYWWRTIDPNWRLADPLTVEQAASLIAGVDPHWPGVAHMWGKWRPDTDDPIFVEDCMAYRTALAALSGAVRGGALKATCRSYADAEHTIVVHFAGGSNEVGVIRDREPDWRLTTVTVADLAAWMESKGIRTGFFSPDGTDDVPGYLDPKHPRYAPKLAAAVRAWEAVTDPCKESPRNALMKWLREHAVTFGLTKDDGTLNKTGIDEVAKVANWAPDGGAPKTLG